MEQEISYKNLFNVGDHIIIKLKSDDIFEGDISDLAESRIDLINVKQHNNENKLTGVYTFYRNEIDDIKRIKVKEKEKPLTGTVEDNFDNLELTDSEYDRIKEMTRAFVYLDKADSRYFEAVDLLSRAETIGVVGLGTEKSRIASIKLLVVSTWDQVFLFDFVPHKQNYFYPELKDILEAEYCCKVIHEAGPLLDILYRVYKVYVNNTFDTQIVDLIIKRKETGSVPVYLSNVSDLLTDHLKFPSSYLQKALDTTNKKWAERPLSDRRKTYAAQLVAYLITLKEHMQKVLFGEIYEAIEKIHDFYFNLDCFQFSKNWQDRTIPKEIQNLIPNLKNNLTQNQIKNTPKSSVSSVGVSTEDQGGSLPPI